MSLPLFHADLVYEALHSGLDLKCPPDQLIDPTKWDNPQNYGLSSWSGHASMYDAKRPLFADLLAGVEGDFIIEGFSLSFPEERALVMNAVGAHRSILLRIDLPFERWKQFYATRSSYIPHDWEYNEFRSHFRAAEHDAVYTFRDPAMVDVHYAEYQKAGFTDKKIEALKIPVQPGDIINDVGCNEGLIGKWCLDQGASVAHGYEQNWRFLDKARENGLVPHLGNVEQDPMETADITLCVSVFHYFENPQAFLRKARAATNRLFILELPIFQDAITGKSVDALVAKFEPQGANFDVTRYSAKLIETWLWRNFKHVEFVGKSVPPDNSLRYVYHCFV